MIVDTGKARISLFNDKENIIVVDIYANGELGMNDVDDIHAGIEKFDVSIPVDTICVKSGNNYLSKEAFEYSLEHNCIHNQVVYVIKHMEDIHFPSHAQETYFKEHLVDYCTSLDEAFRLIKNSSHQPVKHCPS